jgi:hypothetical protein
MYNDVFALFLDGVNIATAPDGQIASINTINCGNPYNGTTGPNCDAYNNNMSDDGQYFYATEYDGFTDVITASALGIGAGTHHIKIAIADASDPHYDTAVFIQYGSFSLTNYDGPADVPEPSTLALFSLSLQGMGLTCKKMSSLHQ